jgi:hypothetical protein
MSKRKEECVRIKLKTEGLICATTQLGVAHNFAWLPCINRKENQPRPYMLYGELGFSNKKAILLHAF